MGEFPNEIILEHTKDIATLKSEVSELQDKVSDMSDIKQAIMKLTILQEEQSKFSGEVSETLKEMKLEIRETKTEVKSTNNKVNDLENKFEKSEQKNMIDIRDVEKTKATDWLIKHKWELGGATVIIIEVLKYIINFINTLPVK